MVPIGPTVLDGRTPRPSTLGLSEVSSSHSLAIICALQPPPMATAPTLLATLLDADHIAHLAMANPGEEALLQLFETEPIARSARTVPGEKALLGLFETEPIAHCAKTGPGEKA